MLRLIDRLLHEEHVNFVLTNGVPRRLATRIVGWFSRLEHPLVRDASIAALQYFAGDLELHDARKRRFSSLHDCFTRELKDGARSIDRRRHVLVSPCDGIVGACGRARGEELVQAKGMTYTLADLVGDAAVVNRFRDGAYVTLRLTASMYHRFHAPADGTVRMVRYISGDTWNVNPPTVKRVARLFCRNERAVIPISLAESDHAVALVAVGAILVASIRLGFLEGPLDLRSRAAAVVDCEAVFAKGDELGYFQHGSTIIVLASPGLRLCPGVTPGQRIRVGEPLFDHGVAPAPSGTR
jgi:phosphatidylserine decarboxylase